MIKIGAGCKPNSVPACAGHDHLTQDAGHPAPRATYPEASDGQPASASLFGLAPGGVYPAFCVATKAVSSYLAISPLPVPARRRAIGGVFSVALSCSYLQFALRTTVPCGVRTFLSGACPERSCARPKFCRPRFTDALRVARKIRMFVRGQASEDSEKFSGLKNYYISMLSGYPACNIINVAHACRGAFIRLRKTPFYLACLPQGD